MIGNRHVLVADRRAIDVFEHRHKLAEARGFLRDVQWLCAEYGAVVGCGQVVEFELQVRHGFAVQEAQWVELRMLMAAHERGDVEVERELRRGLRRHDWNNALRYLGQALFRGGLRRLRRRYRDAELDLAKVELRPDLEL